MLKQPEIHVRTILRLADYIEMLPKGNHLIGPKPKGNSFGMEGFITEHECGTVACIAGHLAIMMKSETYQTSWVAEQLGISVHQAKELCILGPRKVGLSLGDVVAKQAARVLRHLAITGQVDWSQAQ